MAICRTSVSLPLTFWLWWSCWALIDYPLKLKGPERSGYDTRERTPSRSFWKVTDLPVRQESSEDTLGRRGDNIWSRQIEILQSYIQGYGHIFGHFVGAEIRNPAQNQQERTEAGRWVGILCLKRCCFSFLIFCTNNWIYCFLYQHATFTDEFI